MSPFLPQEPPSDIQAAKAPRYPWIVILVLMTACMPIFFSGTPALRPIAIAIQLVGLISVLIINVANKRISKVAFAICMTLFALLGLILAWIRFAA
ncbi:MAG: hypothetical protein LWX11_03425 [Firmicutes bacterium]|nr:hypothetical protein [Bacillota bacterium]